MTFHAIFAALQNTSFATAIREDNSLFPWIEAVHVLGAVFVVGTISIIDMRLMGLPAHRRSVRMLMRDVLPITWAAFALSLTTGLLLFSSQALKYVTIWEFDVKMALLLAAGVNMAWFHLVTFRDIHLWDELSATPVPAKVAATFSLCLWGGIVILGRLIGFAASASRML